MEFMMLAQGEMTVPEYEAKITKFSVLYTTHEVVDRTLMAKKNGEEVMKNVDRRNKRQGPEQKSEQFFNPSKRLNTGTPSGTIQTTNFVPVSNVSRGSLGCLLESFWSLL
ncbi:hypothetical protein U1Q18_009992 [Sarracenia purpurea var. burkii]